MSQALNTIIKRPRGRPGKVDTMNILERDIEDVAETIKLRIMSYRGQWEVHVDPAGAVYLDQPLRPRYAAVRPDGWLVGTYTSSVPVQTIEDDLVERLKEITKAAR